MGPSMQRMPHSSAISQFSHNANLTRMRTTGIDQSLQSLVSTLESVRLEVFKEGKIKDQISHFMKDLVHQHELQNELQAASCRTMSSFVDKLSKQSSLQAAPAVKSSIVSLDECLDIGVETPLAANGAQAVSINHQ